MHFIDQGSRIIAVDASEQEVGEITFTRMGTDLASFDHTFVNPELRGHSIAEMLVQKAVEVMRKENRKVLPYCSYVERLFERKKEYADIWAQDK